MGRELFFSRVIYRQVAATSVSLISGLKLTHFDGNGWWGLLGCHQLLLLGTLRHAKLDFLRRVKERPHMSVTHRNCEAS